MSVVATVTIPSDSFVLGEILGIEGIQVELTQFVPVENELVPYFWASNHEIAEFEAAVRADQRVATLTAFDRAANSVLYRIEWEDSIDGFLDALSEHDVLVESATGTAEEWTFRFRAHESDALTRFHHTCREEAIPLTVKQVQHNPTGHDDDSYELTPKQRETVLLAFEAGYFDVPRGISMTELGEELKISRQAASRRLSRGLHALIAHTLSAEPASDNRWPATDDVTRERSR